MAACTRFAVTDDFAISTSVIAQGYRLVFEPEALATEVAVPQAQREFRRRVRLMTRGLRGVFLRRRLLNPRKYGFTPSCSLLTSWPVVWCRWRSRS